MAKKMKFTLVIDDPERGERLEIDLDSEERGWQAIDMIFYTDRIDKIRQEGLSREEVQGLIRTTNRTEMRYFANRIINTKTGEVLKDMPMKAKRAMPKRKAA